jgi:hypothetical protein
MDMIEATERRAPGWDTVIGWLLTALGLAGTVFFWPFVTYLVLVFPMDILRGQADIEGCLTAIYGLTLLFFIVTGISLHKHYRTSYVFSLLTIILTYLALGTWLAVGLWPLERLGDRGSTNQPLMFGSRLLVEGESSTPYVINPHEWLMWMGILTLVCAALIVMCVRYRGGENARR